jgi:hypothetical protein
MLITALALGLNNSLWVTDSDPTAPCTRLYTGSGRFAQLAPTAPELTPTRERLFGLDAQGHAQSLGSPTHQKIGTGVAGVAVGLDKRPWATSGGAALRLKPDNSWETIPTPGYTIRVKPIDANHVWAQIGSDVNVSKAYRWNGSTWTDAGSPTPIQNLQVGMDGTVVTVDFNSVVTRRYRSDGNWDTLQLPAPAPYIAVVSRSEIWCGDGNGNVWRLSGSTWIQEISNPQRTMPPGVAVDGTAYTGNACYNGLGGWEVVGMPMLNTPEMCAAVDPTHAWYSQGSDFSTFSGMSWWAASAVGLTSIGFQVTNNVLYDMLWGCDANGKVYRWIYNNETDFTLIPGSAKRIIGSRWSLDANGNLQADFSSPGPQLGQPILDAAASPSGQTVWAIGADHKLYRYNNQNFSTSWQPIASPPLQAVAGSDDTVWGATLAPPGATRNAIWNESITA